MIFRTFPQLAKNQQRLTRMFKIIPQGRGPQVTRSEHEVREVASAL